jgi:hypothetical protein
MSIIHVFAEVFEETSNHIDYKYFIDFPDTNCELNKELFGVIRMQKTTSEAEVLTDHPNDKVSNFVKSPGETPYAARAYRKLKLFWQEHNYLPNKATWVS